MDQTEEEEEEEVKTVPGFGDKTQKQMTQSF